MPSVLIPSPNVAGDHQTQNARAMVDAGASKLVSDVDATSTISTLVISLINDQKKLQKMNQSALAMAKPDAAATIATEILNLAKSRLN
jgi:UDP-N-acetylglucosamine--N-acetylmuramyl-(pentapeptide) pyrophosphoryl-undecaprenol N-acetylglucosamine transferase